MNALKIKVYEIFKPKFYEQEAAIVIEYFEAKAEEKYQEKKDYLATKDDVGLLRKEIVEAKADLIKWIFFILDWTSCYYFWLSAIISKKKFNFIC